MDNKRYIIALGASAGGLAALSEFFDHTLPDGISYVITTHLHPHQKSLLRRIIQSHSKIEVLTVVHDTAILPNTVYIMPENKTMTIADGKLQLTPRDLSIQTNKAIDIFFKSLAEDTMFYKIAIILSGMGIDGTEGVRVLAASGAYIIAQTPISAGSESMPDSIISSGLADEILEPKEMPEAIVKYLTS